MSKILNYIFYIVLAGLVFGIAFNLLSKRKNAKEFQVQLKVNNFPDSFLSENLKHLSERRLIFIYSEYDCNECVDSILKSIANFAQNSSFWAIQVLVCGNNYGIRQNYYRRNYKTTFAFKKLDENALYQLSPELELPLIIAINENNKILGAWEISPMITKLVLADIVNLND